MRRNLARVLTVALLCVAACSSGKSADKPPSSSSARPPYTPLFAKGPCTDEVPKDARIECGTLTVPEDRSKPDGRKVALPVAIVHPRGGNPAPDPVLYFSGGPGDPGLTNAEGFLTKGQAGNRDVILFDPRGTGRADPLLDCPEVHEATTTILGAAEGFDAEGKVLSGALFACRDRLRATGVDFNQYNTVAVADDAADLRTAMGITDWNLFGVSYGTRVALQMMRAHPEGVRSVTIDSVVPPDQGESVTDVVAAFERVKRVFFDGCAKDQSCSAAYPTLEADYESVITQMNATPYHGTIQNPVLQRQTPITITGADLVAGFSFALYDTDLIPQLPGLIEQLKAGTSSAIIDEVATLGIQFINDVAEAQAAAVLCTDDAKGLEQDKVPDLLKQHPEDSTLLLVADVLCSEFGVQPAPAGFNDPVRSDLPTLVLGDEYDPVAPPEQSKHASETLSHSTFVEFPGLGHGAVFASPECPETIFRAFLANPTGPVDTGCLADMGPPKWAVPGK